MTDTDNSEFNAAIRAAAGIGVEPPSTEEPAPEPKPEPDPDFGAGAGRPSAPAEESMSDLIRAAAAGAWVRGGGVR